MYRFGFLVVIMDSSPHCEFRLKRAGEADVYLSTRAQEMLSKPQNIDVVYDLYFEIFEFIHSGFFKEVSPVLKDLLQTVAVHISESDVDSGCDSSATLSDFIMDQTAIIAAIPDKSVCLKGGIYAQPHQLPCEVGKHQPFSRIGSLRPVMVAQDLQAFITAFEANEPCVIRGGCGFWQSCISWSSLDFWWSFRGRRVPVEVGTYLSDDFEQKLVDLYNFMEYVFDKNDERSPGDKLYLAQYELFTRFPKLEDHVMPQPDVVHLIGSSPSRSVFMGPTGTVSPLHTDPWENLLCQIVGSKYVALFPPSESANVYASIDSSRSKTTNLPNDLTLLDETIIDEKFPMFRKALGCTVELLPGDCLFIPRQWFHFVKSHSPGISLAHFFE